MKFLNFLMVLLLGLVACSDGPKTTGRTVETTNGLAGIVKQNSEPVAYAVVEIFYSDDILGLPVAETLTDSLGYFEFKDISEGEYRLVATHDNFKGQIAQVVADSLESALHIILEQPRTVLIRLGDFPLQPHTRVGFPGTKLWLTIDSTLAQGGDLVFNQVPLGTWSTLSYTPGTAAANQNLLWEPLVITANSPDTVIYELPANLVAHWSQNRIFTANSSGIWLEVTNLLGQPESISMTASIAPAVGTGMEISSLGNNVGVRIDVNDSAISLYSYYSYDDRYAWHTMGAVRTYTPHTWIDIALVVDPPNSVFALYLDGELSIHSITTEPIAYIKGGEQLTIGCHALGEDFNFEGRIKSVSWWNTALTPEQIEMLAAMP